MSRKQIPSMLQWLLVGALLAGAWWPAKPARASTECNVIVAPALDFGTVTGGTAVPVSGQIEIECRSFALSLLGQVRVRMCLHIGDGDAGPGGTLDRYMENVNGDLLRFQIYRDPARTLIWGSNDTPARPTPLEFNFNYVVTLLADRDRTLRHVYGLIPMQSGLAAGTHQNVFSGVDARLDYAYSEPILVLPTPAPTSCTQGGSPGGNASVTFGFTSSATVPNQCTIDVATDVDFGSVPGLIDTPVDQDSTITLTCTRRTAWHLGLDNGQNAAGQARRMRLDGGASHVVYELYRDPARTLRWGATPGDDAVRGEGTGFEQQVTVHAEVPAGQAVLPGQYRDTVTVTVTY